MELLFLHKQSYSHAELRRLMGSTLNRREVLQMLVSTSLASLSLKPQAQGQTSSSIPPGVSKDLVKDVRERISHGISSGESTGMALALISGGRILWEEGFGWADRDAGVNITSHSAFNVESVTKPFSTTLMTTLAAEKKLDLDQPANRYLGSAKIKGDNGDPEKATVRSLGAHCSGLPGTFEALYDGAQTPSANAFLQRFGRLAFPPGEVWEYSNVAFEALGGIAWELTKTDFGALMEKRVLSPLGMRDSFWDTNASRISQGVPRYDQSGRKLPFHLSTTPPSGELLSSAHDLARFAIWNMKLPLQDGSHLLDDFWIDQLHRPVFTSTVGNASTFGWAKTRLSSGETVIHKGGGGPGASTIICFVPEQKLACVVLNNHSTGSLTNAVCDRIMSSYLPAWKTVDENQEPPRTTFTMNGAVAGSWKGRLENDGTDMMAELKVQSDANATLVVGSGPTMQLNNLQMEGKAFLAEAVGTIHSQDPITATAHALRLKVLPSESHLVGRLNAFDLTPDRQGGIPFILTLSKAH